MHVEQVLGHLSADERCQGHTEATTAKRRWFSRSWLRQLRTHM